MKVESIAECSPWCIMQYFWPALSDNMSWKPILVFFLSGHLRLVFIAKLLKQGHRYNEIRKAFSKFYHRHSELIVKFNIGFKLFCNKAYQNLYFMVI